MRWERKTYDYGLRDLVCRTGDVELGVRLGVERSTAASWVRRGTRPVVTADVFDQDEQELRARVLKLESRVRQLVAIARLLMVLVRMSRARLDGKRVPVGSEKQLLVDAVGRAIHAVPLKVALRVLGLTPARYHSWRCSENPCGLDDRSSCPKRKPTQLAAREVRTMRQMVAGLKYRHMSIRALALHAQRIGRVFAAPGTWTRRIRQHGWLRPRRRLHPPKPKDGVRATRPNELWHIDVTIIKLLDGTRLFLHAAIDNFSRRILAWQLASKLDPTTTCEVLTAAGSHLTGEVPTVVADSGVENVNGQVNALLDPGRLKRVLAQVEVSYSNSMIEAWWRCLKHGWLYLHHLDTRAAVERLVTFYVQQHNSVMPHRAFNGRTPDEVYFATAVNLEQELADRRRQARAERVHLNREQSCEECLAREGPAEFLAAGAA